MENEVLQNLIRNKEKKSIYKKNIYMYIYICMYMFITSVFVYVYMGFIFKCIYLGIVFTNEHVFYFDHTIMYIQRKRKNSSEKRRTENLYDFINQSFGVFLHFSSVKIIESLYKIFVGVHILFSKFIFVYISLHKK